MTLQVPRAPAAPIDGVVDVLHGVEVTDPYRWLEDADSEETEAWVAAQNRRTRAALDPLAARGVLRDRMERLLRATVVAWPQVGGDRVFALGRGGGRDQAVLTVRSASDPDVPARALVDPAGQAEDAAVAIDWFRPSPDGGLVAYGLSEGGDENSTLRVLDVDTMAQDDLAITRCRAASVAWLPDGSAFAYTRYPDPAEVDEGEADYHRTVWWHVRGTAVDDDTLVWGDEDLPDRTAWTDIRLSPDGRWMVVHVALGWSRIDVHLVDRESGRRTAVVEGEEAITELQVVGDRLIGTTTLGAPRGRVVTAPLAEPRAEAWETLVPEGDAVIQQAVVAGESLLVSFIDVAVARLHRYRLDGSGDSEIALPGLGALAGIAADPEVERAWFAYESFARPASLFRWVPGQVSTWGGPGVEDGTGPDPDGYAVDQVRYRSTDGTAVPMFLLRRSSTEPGYDTPTVLTGYGGFAIAETPAYSPVGLAVADAGGLFAVAGIRGGFEYGEEWHQAGMRERKQQCFDDFAAAADWLVGEGLTRRDRLAIRGGSNGGLLMGATLTQRPDLCRAVHCAVPLLDMVRFHRFLMAELWVPEYGDPEKAEEFAWLHAYSPYHHVVDGTCYPALLLTTADRDSRVDPCHARKFAARLQAATACGEERPVLLRIEQRAGHGQGKPVGKQIDEAADVLTFLFDQLEVALPVRA